MLQKVEAVRTALVFLVATMLLGLSGCGISRNIVDLQPRPQPPLQELERHLTYADPYAGRPDYVVRRGY